MAKPDFRAVYYGITDTFDYGQQRSICGIEHQTGQLVMLVESVRKNRTLNSSSRTKREGIGVNMRTRLRTMMSSATTARQGLQAADVDGLARHST